MEREALAALEQRVDALRVLTREKAVAARSVRTEPPRHHAELSTALLALVVLAMFLAGREIGIFTGRGASCPSIPAGERAIVSFSTDTWRVTLDTDGNMMRTGSIELRHPETVTRRVSGEAVRAIANRLARGCFMEHQPRGMVAVADSFPEDLTLEIGDRVATYHTLYWPGPRPLCNGNDDMEEIVKAIMDLARVREELFDRPSFER